MTWLGVSHLHPYHRFATRLRVVATLGRGAGGRGGAGLATTRPCPAHRAVCKINSANFTLALFTKCLEGVFSEVQLMSYSRLPQGASTGTPSTKEGFYARSGGMKPSPEDAGRRTR